MDVGQGRKQAVPAHPALTAFVHPCTADAEALRLCESYCYSLVPTQERGNEVFTVGAVV